MDINIKLIIDFIINVVIITMSIYGLEYLTGKQEWYILLPYAVLILTIIEYKCTINTKG